MLKESELLFREVTIVGVGLIGGSLGLALHKSNLVGRVIGCDSSEVLSLATEKGAIDAGFSDLASACKNADLIVMATPVSRICSLLSDVVRYAPLDSLITDVGSTKRQILREAERVFGDHLRTRFIGGHPMAGKELSGIEQADPDLFADATWFFVPPQGDIITGFKALRLHTLLQAICRSTLIVGPDEHDRLCAWISHLPQLLSTALAVSIQQEIGVSESIHKIGGRALREMTRTASSPFSMWGDIFESNADHIACALEAVESNLRNMRQHLSDGELKSTFSVAHAFRSPLT